MTYSTRSVLDPGGPFMFLSRKAIGFHRQTKLFEPNFLMRKTFLEMSNETPSRAGSLIAFCLQILTSDSVVFLDKNNRLHGRSSMYASVPLPSL